MTTAGLGERGRRVRLDGALAVPVKRLRVLLAGVSALLVAVVPAAAAPKPQSMTFLSVQVTAHEAKVSATKTDVTLNDNDYWGTKKIGHDTVKCVLSKGLLDCGIVFTFGKGTIVANARAKDDAPTAKGVISGGTGIYSGATGTLYTKNLDKAGTRTQITLVVA